MLYNDYLSKISTRFRNLLDEISANSNFDYGPEFEIALCVALRAVLPSRFGVCRGWVVPGSGNPAGDDLVIYDRDRFSTLRMIEQDNFARKEEIPLEAVCAYIEAKCDSLLPSATAASEPRSGSGYEVVGRASLCKTQCTALSD